MGHVASGRILHDEWEIATDGVTNDERGFVEPVHASEDGLAGGEQAVVL
jgi:hypothetical protein